MLKNTFYKKKKNNCKCFIKDDTNLFLKTKGTFPQRYIQSVKSQRHKCCIEH